MPTDTAAAKHIRTIYFIGHEGYRYGYQGNSMGDPETPADDHDNKEDAVKEASMVSRPDYPVSVYRCEVYEEGP